MAKFLADAVQTLLTAHQWNVARLHALRGDPVRPFPSQLGVELSAMNLETVLKRRDDAGPTAPRSLFVVISLSQQTLLALVSMQSTLYGFSDFFRNRVENVMAKFTLGTLAVLAAAVGAAPNQTMAQQPLAVVVVEAARTQEQRRSSLTGEIQASQSLMAAFPIGGRVTDVMADLGAKVDEGAPLARLDSIQQELAVRAAEAGLVTARADHLQAEEDFARADALLASGAGTRAVRDVAEDQLRAAEGALAQAEAELDRAKKALADTVLRAPSSSTVIKRMVEPGQIIGAAQPALELALDNGLQAVFEFSEAMLIEGSPSTLELSRLSSPQDSFGGVVSEISPLVDARTGTVAVKVAIPNPPDGITYGDPVRGTATRSEHGLVVLPFEAITASRQGPAVWKVDAETMAVSLHNVRIERYATGLAFLSDGVDDGEWIVTKGSQLLYPGRIVHRVEASE